MKYRQVSNYAHGSHSLSSFGDDTAVNVAMAMLKCSILFQGEKCFRMATVIIAC